jgi:hypothetical protein
VSSLTLLLGLQAEGGGGKQLEGEWEEKRDGVVVNHLYLLWVEWQGIGGWWRGSNRYRGFREGARGRGRHARGDKAGRGQRPRKSR